MAQVVTQENMAQLIETGRVSEFVPPKPDGETKAEPKAEAPAGEPVKTETPAAEQQPAAETPKEEPKAAPEDVDHELPEKAQKRINAKHRQMKEAEEWGKSQYLEKLAAEKRVGELEAKVAELEKSTSPALPNERAEAPKQEDYSTVAEYVDAQVEWKLKQKEAEAVAKAKADADNAIETAHRARIVAAAERIPDYDEVVGKSEINLNIPLLQFIRESESGPDIAFHLAKNPDVAERLNRLSPIKALAEMGKIEEKVKPAAKAEEPKPSTTSQPVTSRAPAPITPIDGNKAPAHKDPATMTFKELRAHNEEQRRLKAAQRR